MAELNGFKARLKMVPEGWDHISAEGAGKKPCKSLTKMCSTEFGLKFGEKKEEEKDWKRIVNSATSLR